MYDYHPPLRDMRFVIEHVLRAPTQWAQIPDFAEVDMSTAMEVLQQAGRFTREVLLPLNAPGDRQGCRLEGGRVCTPNGFPAAWRAYVDAGWPALSCDPHWGGQGLPRLLDAALGEMVNATNHAWNMYAGILHGAYETVKAHGSDDLKARYLSRLASGEWLSAMALTEPQSGSDLGGVRTRAEPQADGSLAVTGSKVFISHAAHAGLFFVVATIDGTSVTLYQDGVLCGTATLSAANKLSAVSTNFAYLAKGGYTGDPEWLGQIHEFRIYNKALTLGEANYLFGQR
mgnify:CR=1 FL=1